MVRCVDCGFLALRNARTRMLDEAEDIYRRTADPSLVGGEYSHERVPVCFARAWNLRDEVDRHISEQYGEEERERWLRNPQREHILAVIIRERQCSGFTDWEQGFIPKEHRDMLDRQEWQEWQERQRREDKRWRVIELVLLIVGAGAFTILGSIISRGGFP